LRAVYITILEGVVHHEKPGKGVLVLPGRNVPRWVMIFLVRKAADLVYLYFGSPSVDVA